MAVATATLRDSDVLALIGKLGIKSRCEMSGCNSVEMPFPSLPMIIKPLGVRVSV